MYVENKDGDIDGVAGRIGWVTFSRSGLTVYYRGRTLVRAQGVRGNHIDSETREEYWVSGVKKNGRDAHYAARITVAVDDDARAEYERIMGDR